MECGIYWQERNGGFCERCLVWCEGGQDGLEKHQLEAGCTMKKEESEYEYVLHKGRSGTVTDEQSGQQTPSSHVGSSTSLEEGQHTPQESVFGGTLSRQKMEQISRWRSQFGGGGNDEKENVWEKVQDPVELEFQQAEGSSRASTCTLGDDSDT